jgi:hypothetical protein
MLDIVLILLAINTIVSIVNRNYLNLSLIFPPFGVGKYFYEKKNVENENPIEYLIASLKGFSLYYIIYCMTVGIWGDSFILTIIPPIHPFILTYILLAIAVLLIDLFPIIYYLKKYLKITNVILLIACTIGVLLLQSVLLYLVVNIISDTQTETLVNTGLFSFYILLALSAALITIFFFIKNWKKAIIYILLISILPFNMYYNVIDIFALSNLEIIITPILIILAILIIGISNIYQLISHWPHNKSKIIKAILYYGSINLILLLTYYLADGNVINSWEEKGVTTFTSKSVTTGLTMVVILLITLVSLITWGLVSPYGRKLKNNN